MSTSTVSRISPGVPRCIWDSNCEKPVRSRCMCVDHYQVWRRLNPHLVKNYAKARDPLGKLYEESIIRSHTGCVEYQRTPDTHGYGRIWHQGKSHIVYRLAYEILVEPIPKGLVLDHLCENGACWHPQHLEPVTQRINTIRGHNSIAASHLAKSHPNCVCWDRRAESCPDHGQLHWRDDWRECVAACTVAVTMRRLAA